MKTSAITLFRLAKSAHETIYRQLAEVQHEINKCSNMVELCDYVFAVDQAHELIEDNKKALWNLREALNKKICELYVRSNPSEPNIKTDYVTATPDVKYSPNIPSKKGNPEAFEKLMKHLGIPTEVMNSEAVRPHWPGLVEFVSQQLAAGKPCPPGIDVKKLMPIFKLTLRRKKEIT